MILAELEVFHSRAIAPTRRLALGQTALPIEPAPGLGAVLLGGIVAHYIPDYDPDLDEGLRNLMTQLQMGQRIVQPRQRYRLQTDRVGLLKSTHRLIGHNESMSFEFGEHDSPAAHVLAAVYAAGHLGPNSRPSALDAIRKAMRWNGPIGPALIAHLSGKMGAESWSAVAFENPIDWALDVLGFGPVEGRPDRSDIKRRFRDELRSAHPDHGGDDDHAAKRITELSEARRILLA